MLLNARDAMPEGGLLHLSIDNGWHPDQYFIATAVLRVSTPVREFQQSFKDLIPFTPQR